MSLLFEMLGNMCTVITCYTGRDVKNFEINLNFVINPFSHMIEKPWTKILIP